MIDKGIRFILKKLTIARSFFYLILYKFMYSEFVFKDKVFLDRFVRIKITNNGSITINENCTIERNCTLVAKWGHIEVGENTFIGEGSILVANSGIEVGQNCLIASGVTIRDQDHGIYDLAIPIRHQKVSTEKISIGSDVWIGTKATILKGVCIGDQSVIGANSVVTKSVPPRVIAVGSPAKIIKYRTVKNI